MANLRTDYEDGELFVADFLNETNRAVNDGISTAAQAAEDASGYLADLQEAIADLPDGQAVSAQVAINEADIAGLKSEIVVDLSTRYSTSYANLSAALTALNSDTATDATAIKRGGVSIKFINSTTNKYEQWNLKASSWSTNTSDWALDVDGSVTNGKLKLPFELEKPNTQTPVTQAECVGYGENSNVKEVLDNMSDVGLNVNALINSGALETATRLTPAQSGLSGYVMAGLQFGTVGSHAIFNIEEGKFYAIKVKYTSITGFYYTITDVNDNVLFEINSGQIFGSDTTDKTYIFKCYKGAAKLYVTMQTTTTAYRLSHSPYTIAEIYSREAFGNFERAGYVYKNGGDSVAVTSNSVLNLVLTNEGELGYTISPFSGARLFTIDSVNDGYWRNIYISDPYIVNRGILNNTGFINCVIYNSSNIVVYAGIIKTNILSVPNQFTVLIVGTAVCTVKKDCNIESVSDNFSSQISEFSDDIANLEDKTSIEVAKSPLIPFQTSVLGYVSYNIKVGEQISFGTFGDHDIYNIEAGKRYKITIQNYPGGNAYCYAITDASDTVLEIVMSGKVWGDDTSGVGTYVFQVHQGQAKIYVSQHATGITCSAYESTDLKNVVEEVLVDIENLDGRVEALEETSPANFFALKDFACDGDSILGWHTYTNNKLHFKTLSNNSQGNCKCLDRTSSTSGVTKSPQWAPDCTQENPFIDYKGLSDPNYGDDDSVYQKGTEEFDQATANNCIYGHLGRLIKMVNDGVYPTPQIFIMNIMGANDTWGTGSIDATIGTFEEAISGSYDQIQRNTILNSIRWFVTKFRITFPQCKLFWKTSTQQSAEMHANFYKIEEPLLQLLRYLSVPVIDSYAEVGIMRELEHYDNNKRSQNQWTSDGTHPTSAGYQMDGDFVASKLKSWFSAFFY